MTFGEKLQALRKSRGLSQDALADMLDVSRQAVSKWELDNSSPDTENLVRLADILQTSTDYLLGYEAVYRHSRKNLHINMQKVFYPLVYALAMTLFLAFLSCAARNGARCVYYALQYAMTFSHGIEFRVPYVLYKEFQRNFIAYLVLSVFVKYCAVKFRRKYEVNER